MTRKRFLVAVAVTLASLSACSSLLSVERAARVRVELDIFSGLPNPHWTLTRGQAAELDRRLRGSPRAPDHPLPDPTLGYRGFRLTNLQSGDAAWTTIYVTAGLLWVDLPGGVTHVYHDSRDLEEWLLEQAVRRGY